MRSPRPHLIIDYRDAIKNFPVETATEQMWQVSPTTYIDDAATIKDCGITIVAPPRPSEPYIVTHGVTILHEYSDKPQYITLLQYATLNPYSEKWNIFYSIFDNRVKRPVLRYMNARNDPKVIM